MKKDLFVNRHVGPSANEVQQMLATVNAKSIEEVIEKTVPANIRLKNELAVGEAYTEFEYLKHLRSLAKKNQVFDNYIGLGYYGTILPAVIQRNILENPGWYTAYTPYQAEIAQGRLEALLNFQTMVSDLTRMPIANASLLDEATAAAEAMSMMFASRTKEMEKASVDVFVVSDSCFPQTIDLLKTRSQPLGIKLEISSDIENQLHDRVFGIMLQYPDKNGEVKDYSKLVQKAKANNIQVAVASDLLALALLTPPGEWGADIVFGNSQRFGVPMGYGGPHAAFFTSKEDYKRVLPGRIIGVSLDAEGNPALRMALQTREQHIRRDKATSNICTAQALLAIMAGMYAVYHGPDGIKGIASQVHSKAVFLNHELKNFGFNTSSKIFFDTIQINEIEISKLRTIAEKNNINLRYEENSVFVSVDEVTGYKELNNLLGVFAEYAGKNLKGESKENIDNANGILGTFAERKSNYLEHKIFNSYHSESELMRYIKRLENKDLSLTHSMISLGSCTMKLNAAAELLPLTWPEFANIHPFAPMNQVQGYQEIIAELDKDLSNITGFAAMSFQPNSGAQGEYTGLLVIQAYHQANGNGHRNVALIPSSAHGTNPASAAMCGMKIIVVKCDELGNIDVDDLRDKAEKNAENLSCLMVTYPSTHGVFEERIIEITDIIHKNGGQVYMDGANMNAQVGLTSPGNIGADVCHLNLHKTFAIPHGGGGPGMGPIGVAKHLVPFLPTHTMVKTGGEKGIHAVSAAPYGSSLILLISYGYIKMLGSFGLKRSTEMAILNANYMKEKLKDHYPILYIGKNGMVAHEMIVDCKGFKKSAGVEVADIAKRLMDFGFHAPTVAFPVHDTLMIEPTESESKEELDRFCDAMITIRKEIDEIANGEYDQSDNVIKNAPHTVKLIAADNWTRKYPRSKAAYPTKWVRDNKFWPSVSRVDNAHGDRNLICTCPPIEEYMTELV